MKLFSPDLYRNFGIGFAGGAALVIAVNGGTLLAALPQSIAALFF